MTMHKWDKNMRESPYLHKKSFGYQCSVCGLKRNEAMFKGEHYFYFFVDGKMTRQDPGCNNQDVAS